MGFRPGHAKLGGRKRGTPNALTAALKDAILGAFHAAGGRDYLVTVARTDPRTFCALLGRVLPSELRAELSGPVTAELIILDYGRDGPRSGGNECPTLPAGGSAAGSVDS